MHGAFFHLPRRGPILFSDITKWGRLFTVQSPTISSCRFRARLQWGAVTGYRFIDDVILESPAMRLSTVGHGSSF